MRSLVEKSTDCSQIIVGYITNVKQQEKWSIEGILWEIIDHASEVKVFDTVFPYVTRLLSHCHFLAILVKVVVLA